jgi:preprotein translocase subunit Sec61beta
VKLRQPRFVIRPDLPADLVKFYEQHEGVGLESSPDRVVRICLLDEASRISWQDLHVIGMDTVPGWSEGFAAVRIGISQFFDEILYVLKAPVCAEGSILTIGVGVAGPEGSGADILEAALVLANSFTDWLQHLKQVDWVEYGLVPGAIKELPEATQKEIRRYYLSLNPGITWGAT